VKILAGYPKPGWFESTPWPEIRRNLDGNLADGVDGFAFYESEALVLNEGFRRNFGAWLKDATA